MSFSAGNPSVEPHWYSTFQRCEVYPGGNLIIYTCWAKDSTGSQSQHAGNVVTEHLDVWALNSMGQCKVRVLQRPHIPCFPHRTVSPLSVAVCTYPQSCGPSGKRFTCSTVRQPLTLEIRSGRGFCYASYFTGIYEFVELYSG